MKAEDIAECDNCYKCVLYEGGNCVECEYDESYCEADDEIENEEISWYCETILALDNNCARSVYLPAENTFDGDSDVFVNCDGGGTSYDETLLNALCGENDTCLDTLAVNWVDFTEALCYSSSAAEMAEYLGYDCVSAGYDMDFATDCEVCDSGYYYSDGSCAECPRQDGAVVATTVSGFAQPITTCYIPAQSLLADATGTYSFSENCPYTE